MKTYFIIFIICCTLFSLQAQSNQDLKWDAQFLAGYDLDEFDNTRTIRFTFNENELTIDTILGPLKFYQTVGALCDDEGNPKMFTNGCRIIDKNLNEVAGSDGINLVPESPSVYEGLCGYGDEEWSNAAYNYFNNMIFLPVGENKIKMINQPLQYIQGDGVEGIYTYQTTIEKQEEEYIVTEMKKIIYQAENEEHTLSSHLAACRHANGRDWWLIFPTEKTNIYRTYFVGSDTTYLTNNQAIGINFDPEFDSGSGKTVFTPDGTKMVDYALASDVKIMDFDRCTGELSDFVHIPITDAADTIWGASVAISPNSRFAYLSSSLYIYQVDLWADDIPASMQTVAIYDGFVDEWGHGVLFNQALTGPDGKIYISSTGGRRWMHVIEEPDSLGLACQVKQHDINLPEYFNGGFPNYPVFHLDALEGSGCDTIVSGIRDVVQRELLNIIPNPASDEITFNTSTSSDWSIYSVSGEIILQGKTVIGQNQVNTSDLLPGFYFLRLNDAASQTAKFIIQR